MWKSLPPTLCALNKNTMKEKEKEIADYLSKNDLPFSVKEFNKIKSCL